MSRTSETSATASFYWHTAVGIAGLSVIAVYWFIGSILRDRGFTTAEAAFFSERAFQAFEGSAGMLAGWLMTFPAIPFQPVLLLYPFAGAFAPVLASSMGVVLLAALLYTLLLRTGAGRLITSVAMLLFLLHPVVIFAAVSGGMWYLTSAGAVLFAWSLASYMQVRSDRQLAVMALAVTLLLFADLAFLSLVLLTWPVVLYARLRDSRATPDEASPEIRKALRETILLPALPLGAGLLYLLFTRGLAMVTGAPLEVLTVVPVPEDLLPSDVAHQFLTALPFVLLLVLASYTRPAVLIASSLPFIAVYLGTLSGQGAASHLGIPMMAIMVSVVMMAFAQFRRWEDSREPDAAVEPVPAAGKGVTALTLLAALLFSVAGGFQLMKDGPHRDIHKAYAAFLFDREADLPAASLEPSERLRGLFPSADAETESPSSLSESIASALKELENGDGASPAPQPPVSTPPSPDQSDTSETTPPSPDRADTPVTGPVVDTGEDAPVIRWNDSDRYYFEVRITTNTGASTARNYQSWLDQAGEEVTLMPQYRPGLRIRWLIGTGRYPTFRAGVDQIVAERGRADNVFITLHHLTDFRVFGDAPDFNPAEPGFSILLGTHSSADEARIHAISWKRAGLDQVRIIPEGSNILVVTGRYNDEDEARMLALVVTQKTGRDASVIALP